jgi:flagellar protein FliS
MLYQGARAAIAQARLCLAQDKIAERGQAISKAIQIINDGLKASLNKEAGGELSANLDRLYDYLVRTLLRANLNADDPLLEHADKLLGNLAEAWQTAIDAPSATRSEL